MVLYAVWRASEVSAGWLMRIMPAHHPVVMPARSSHAAGFLTAYAK